MITKMYKAIGECPFQPGTEVGSPGCRTCQNYRGEPAYCAFVICNHDPADVRKSAESVPKTAQSVPKTAQSVRKSTKNVPETRKRGRPAKKAENKPVKRKLTKK